MRARFRSLLVNLCLLAVTTAVTCAAAEIGLRLFRPQPLEAAYVWPDGTLRHIPSFVYRYSRPGFSNLVSFNSLGLRGPEVAAGKRPGVPRVLFLGDSFVEGKQVADDEVLTAVLSRLAARDGRPLEVINAGVAGYGTTDELLLWEQLGRSLRPDLVIVGFYPNDVRNNLERRWFVLRDGAIVPGHAPHLPKVRWIYDLRKLLASHSHLWMLLKAGKTAWHEREEEALREEEEVKEGVPLQPSLLETEDVFAIEPSAEIARGWRLTEALLTELKRRVDSTGARFVLAVFPSRYQVDDALWRTHAAASGLDPGRYDMEIPDRRLAAWAASTGTTIVDLLPDFRSRNTDNSFYFSIDAHWNPAGQELAGEVIYRRLRSAGF